MIDVRIRTVVVRGLRVPNAHRLGPAIEAELARRLVSGEPPAVRTPLRVRGPVAPERLAPAVADAVHRELTR